MDEAGELERRLRALGGHPIDPRRSAQDLTAIAALARPPAARTGFFASKVRVAAAFLAGLLIGSTGLAAADALPDPAQHVAHRVLAQVGVDVPNPERYHGPECGPEQKRNHGAYVRDDRSLASSDCGKKVGAGTDDGEGDGGPGQGQGQGNGKPASDDPCRGKPPWAGNTSMTPEEVAAAKAAREACPDDDATEAPEVEERQAELAPDASTTTIEPSTTTTEATTTTTTEATTTTTATP